MLPIRDDIPPGRYPVVKAGLIVVNILVFFHELRRGPELENFCCLQESDVGGTRRVAQLTLRATRQLSPACHVR